MRTLVALPAMVVLTLFWGVAAIVVGLLFPRRSEFVCLGWSRGMVWACGVKVRQSGGERLDPAARYVFVANHQSLLDIPALWVSVPNRIRFVAKQELARIPIFGRAMKAVGTVIIDRANPASAAKALEEARHGIGRQVSLVFFAEGTRNPNGPMRPFKRGAANTALASGLALVPVALSGTGDVIRKESFLVKPGAVGVAIGTPIPLPSEATPQNASQLTRLLEEEVGRLLPLAQALRSPPKDEPS